MAQSQDSPLVEQTTPRAPSALPAGDLQPADAFLLRLMDGPGAPDAPELWLALQCRLSGGVRHALLQLGAPDQGPYLPAASWPAGKAPAQLRSIAAEVLAKRTALAYEAADEREAEADAGSTGLLVAEPILIEGALHGVVAFEVSPRVGSEVEGLRRRLRLGLGWLDAHIERKAREAEGGSKDRIETVLGLLATTLEHDRFQGAATAFVTELASVLDCDRVSVGFLRNGKLRLDAVSHSARFGRRTNLVRCIEAAMEEALDNQETVVFPAPEASLPRAAQAHKELSRQFGARAICSVPLVRGGEACAAVTLERDEPFAGRVLGLVEVATALVGPPLDALRLESRSIFVKILDSLRDLARRFFGPHHVALKLIGTSVSVLLVFLALARGTYRITADAVLVPDLRRVAVAPFDGFIAEAPVRAGDVVAAGDLLVSLDDRDLELERLKWQSEHAQALKQYRKALADRDSAQAEILMAAVEESRAELDRIVEHLARSDLRAPFDGVVVVGDLSQQLGAPVRRGDVLFEVAPLDAYRVQIQVGEGEISDIELGQHGSLVLAALPGDEFRFAVDKITPVSTAEEGRNTFLVEAKIEDDTSRLRPGVEGVAKVEVDQRKLIWIWTHDLIDWVRLKLWTFLP